MEASTREYLRGLLQKFIHSTNMLKGLLSVFHNKEVSFLSLFFLTLALQKNVFLS